VSKDLTLPSITRILISKTLFCAQTESIW